MKIDELKNLLEQQSSEVKDLAAVNDMLDAVMGEEKEEETSEETAEEEEEEKEEETSAEEATEEPAEEPAEEETKEEVVELAVIIEGMTQMKQEIANLKSQLAEANKAKEETEKKLSAKVAAEQEFLKKFKTLTAVVADEKKPVEMPTIGMTNGIGEG